MKITSTNPSDNYAVLGEVEAHSPVEIEAAVAKAHELQPAWAALTQPERDAAVNSFAALCEAHADEIATLISQEMGKPIRSSRDSHMADGFTYFKEYIAMAEDTLRPEIVYETATERHTLTREPLGVIACIAPWNFPFLNIPWQAGQALLAGNAVLYKPSEEIVLFSQYIAKLVEQSDIPKGVFTIIIGDGSAGEVLVQQPVDAISFTGSTQTGQRVTELAARSSTKVLTEMGGSAPGIVFEDADVPKIIETLYAMRFDNSGQYCDGLKRLIVHETKYDEVIRELQRINATRKVGNAMDETSDLGPLVARRQLETLIAQCDDAFEKGAMVVFGGKQPAGLRGAYYEPTLLANINTSMRVWKEEVFGPVLPIVTFTSEEQAIEIANDTSYGLGAYVFTESHDRFTRVAHQLCTGNVAHNNALYFSTRSPFGGYKASGNSRTCGREGFHEITQIKLISEEK